MTSIRKFSASPRTVLCVALFCVAITSAPRAVCADEFSTVAASDSLYRSMSVLSRSGWISAPATNSATIGTKNPSALLTRYEMALQTAEAIYTVQARHDADAAWDATASVTSLRALRDLTTSLRPELQKLGVDTNAALRLMTRLSAPAAASSTRNPLLSTASEAPAEAAFDVGTMARGGLSLARRFNIESAVSALERESQDPLGNGIATRVQGAGLAFDVSRGLSLHAGVAKRDLTMNPASLARLGLQNIGTLGDREERSFGGGLDFSLRKGLLFSTQIEKVRGDDAASGATRLTGGVGLTAWQNRLSLVAKLSRLTPEDINSMAPSTTANVGLGLNVSSNLSVNLLYQRLFSAPSTGRSGVLAGGVSIKF